MVQINSFMAGKVERLKAENELVILVGDEAAAPD